MTDRIYALTVAFETNLRADDIQKLIDAIGMMRGVLSVKKHVADPVLYVAREQARGELRDKILGVLFED